MRTRLACLVAAALLALCGCTGGGARDAPRAASSAGSPSGPHPTPGGQATVRPEAQPTQPMDDLEKPIARRLASQVAGQGLKLDYLNCPRWDRKVPGDLHCVGFFDGVRAAVRVRLRAMHSGAVSFEATLQRGIVATHALVDRLRRMGYRRVDCGDAPAYPASVGSRLVCAVSRDGRRSYVVATVTDRSGAVMIRGY